MTKKKFKMTKNNKFVFKIVKIHAHIIHKMLLRTKLKYYTLQDHDTSMMEPPRGTTTQNLESE